MAAQFDDTLIIFDLDGTLVDSAPDLAAALNHTLKADGLAPVDPQSVRSLVGQGARALIKRGFTERGRPLEDEAEIAERQQRFLAYYDGHYADQSKPFEGVTSCLTRLQAEGARLAVCTNKPEAFAGRVIEAFGLTDFFVRIAARETYAEPKPSALPLLSLQAEMGCRRAIMVGDTETDREAARRADHYLAFALFGYGEADPPLETPREDAFDHFDTLPAVLAAFPYARGET